MFKTFVRSLVLRLVRRPLTAAETHAHLDDSARRLTRRGEAPARLDPGCPPHPHGRDPPG